MQAARAKQAAAKAEEQTAFDAVRRKYLNELYTITGRNIIAYYSGFLSKPDSPLLDINDEDKNGFMMAVHKLNRRRGLDLILHTPGGSIGATQSIVRYLHQMFDGDIRAIVPQIAMSAGTMIACSCREIFLAKHSNLGPIDPHVDSYPAYGIISEFDKALKQCKSEPAALPLWQSIIGQYSPTLIERCENAISWSNAFVKRQLECVMFKDLPLKVKKRKAARVVGKLTDFRGNKTHDRHIQFEECESIGLIVKRIESDERFQDLVLTVHHCYMHSLMNTGSVKIIENQDGVAFIKQQIVQQVPVSG